jgi:hypothetical protein
VFYYFVESVIEGHDGTLLVDNPGACSTPLKKRKEKRLRKFYRLFLSPMQRVHGRGLSSIAIVKVVLTYRTYTAPNPNAYTYLFRDPEIK